MNLSELLFEILKTSNNKLSLLELEISDNEFWSNESLHIEELKEKYPDGLIAGITIQEKFNQLCKKGDKLALLELKISDNEFWVKEKDNHIDAIESYYEEEIIIEYINKFSPNTFYVINELKKWNIQELRNELKRLTINCKASFDINNYLLISLLFIEAKNRNIDLD